MSRLRFDSFSHDIIRTCLLNSMQRAARANHPALKSEWRPVGVTLMPETHLDSPIVALYKISGLHQNVTLEITTCTKSSRGYLECGPSEYEAQSGSSDGLKQLGHGARSAMNEDAGMLRQFQPLEVL